MFEAAPITFLHTARPNVALFHQLVTTMAPSVRVRHELLESVLLGAVGTGEVTDVMRQETEVTIRRLVAEGARLIVCTCSTIGGVAEATQVDTDVRVMRIDRPMAEAAVASGCRIVVAATLPSTLRPTIELIQQVAAAAGQAAEIVELLCASAWQEFERGDAARYAEAIVETVCGAARSGDVVVLAQASMAPAAGPINAMGIRALASPESGVRAALDFQQAATARL